ncbi:autorepressor SdpR family transcription factor [Lacticaseibacillus pantheris]|jgi:DNA-binding transcriptional ArsR family regulator|uniref:autorepressor SdpR family transcription factor n=1 Tax=Lacticaseibacillus pantheris TaxID=171523 RepID=UPI0025945A63|nr:autorepressor SdpR family transcription factor [Lacticaseibacillus pantheris]WKF84936.1 autorepressor SdpR family transcription factor [Lacticaseibacillus pantheris]
MAMTETLKAIADPVRREILELLKQHSYSAGEIADHFELSQATVSYHLKLLKQAELISERREKNFIYYDINASVFEDVLTWIYSIGGSHHE